MALIEEMPSAVEAALRTHRNGTADEPLTAAVRADIDSEGRLGERWVTVDSAAVRVYTLHDGSAQLSLSLPLSEIRGADTETLVGGGALIVDKGADKEEVARFTTSRAATMGGLARTLDALSQGRDLPQLDAEEERLCPTCGRPLPGDTDVCRFCINRSATLARLLSYAAPFKWKAILMVVLMLTGTVTTLVPGYLIKGITDHAMIPNGTSNATRLSWLGFLVAGLIVARLADTGFSIFRGRLSAFLSGSITRSIRDQIFDRLQSLGMSFYDKRQTGALMTRVTQDVNELNNFLVDGLQFLVVNGLTMIGILTVMLYTNPRLTLLTLLPAPLVVLATQLSWKFMRRRWHRIWHTRSSLSAGLNSVLTGARVVKAFAQEERERERFNRRSFSLFQAQVNAEQVSTTIFPLLGLLMTSGSLIVWYVGGKEVIGETTTFGTLNMFLFFQGQLFGPLQQMTRIADWLSRATTAAERVFEVMDTEPDIADNDDAIPMPAIRGEVTFENVAFGYDKTRRVLEEFDLHVQPGEMIGLVGHSGAGKTTIINLLSRFYDPVEGTIKIDGEDLRNIKVGDLRSQFGIVLQEPFLFPGTINDNIAYAKPDASPEEVMRAAKAANAHDFIMRFPDGYDTQVGERGVKLSGGERQRLSIARAILHDPRILILDEATASVDTETEKQIQEAIQRLIKGRTTFAIAHRLSTLRNADRLVVIDKGKLAEVGTHDELMEKENGIFRRLVEMQTEINKLRTAEHAQPG